MYLLSQYIINKKGFYPSAHVWHTNIDPPAPPAFAAQGLGLLDDPINCTKTVVLR